jgi:DNA polymerase III epsilon subunit-like protein
MARATWFCVDIECGGPVPGLYDMLSLGAVPVVGETAGELALRDGFYVEIRPTAPRVDPGAMAVNGLDLDALRRDGLELAEALTRLTDFVRANTAPGSEPVFVGHNAPFDWSFVAWAYAACGLPNPFGYKALDTKALAMGVLGVHWLDTNKELLERELALPAQDAARTHRADYDAWFQAHILMGLLRRRPTCVGS